MSYLPAEKRTKTPAHEDSGQWICNPNPQTESLLRGINSPETPFSKGVFMRERDYFVKVRFLKMIAIGTEYRKNKQQSQSTWKCTMAQPLSCAIVHTSLLPQTFDLSGFSGSEPLKRRFFSGPFCQAVRCVIFRRNHSEIMKTDHRYKKSSPRINMILVKISENSPLIREFLSFRPHTIICTISPPPCITI